MWNYNISVGSIEWVRSFESSVFYFSVDNRELIFYDDYIVLPLEDKIVFLEFRKLLLSKRPSRVASVKEHLSKRSKTKLKVKCQSIS